MQDIYGHDVGDLILKFVATTFVANARPFDIYGRWGGEEFIGIMNYSTEFYWAILDSVTEHIIVIDRLDRGMINPVSMRFCNDAY